MSVAATALETTSQTTVTSSPGFLRRLLRIKTAVVSLGFLLLVALTAILAPLLLPHVRTQRIGDLTKVQQMPSSSHWLGTDSGGRDVLERLLVGTRVTAIGVLQVVLVALVIGLPIGLMAGYRGGKVDRVVGWLTDLMLALPGIVLILAVLAVFPYSLTAAMVTLGVLTSPGIARVVRSAVLPVKQELYIASARVSGLSDAYIVTRHVLPRIAGPIIIQTSLLAATALVAQAGLAFLQLIEPPPTPSWGGMITDGAQVIATNGWLIWPPGILLAATTLALGLLGDGARDAAAEGWSHHGTVPRAARRVRRLVEADQETAPQSDVLLSIEDLNVRFYSADKQPQRVVGRVTFDIRPGEVVGLVGESGCGKTATAMAIIGVLPDNGAIESGRIMFGGRNLAALSERDLSRMRGRDIALISQEPMVSLNPAFRVGWQLIEVIRRRTGVSRKAAKAEALNLLRQVRLPDPEAVLRRYPHELSGGMAQRVVIARALAGEPRLLIADEPTTALDVTVQAEILQLLTSLQRERNMAILLITHDWGVVADLCDRAVVMYAGEVVERSAVDTLFGRPAHPYTAGLLASNPHRAEPAAVLTTIPGTVPRPEDWPIGCHFQDRCPFVIAECRSGPVELALAEDGQEVRCVRAGDAAVSQGWPAQ